MALAHLIFFFFVHACTHQDLASHLKKLDDPLLWTDHYTVSPPYHIVFKYRPKHNQLRAQNYTPHVK